MDSVILTSKSSRRAQTKPFAASQTSIGKSVLLISTAFSLLQSVSFLPALAADPSATAPANKKIAALEVPAAKDADKAKATLAPPMTPVMAPLAPSAAAQTTTPTSNTPATPGAPATATTAVPDATQESDKDASAAKFLLKPGQPLILNSETEDVQPTDDVNLAKEQAQHFPDSAEAAFILAVALTRTSRVEEALAEVRVARKLAQAQGGPTYFDKMIKSYEEMLQTVDDPRVRYSLAWAYYMKAYLLAQDSRRALGNPAIAAAAVAPVAAAPAPAAPVATPPAVTPPALQNTAVPNTISAKAEKKKVDPNIAIALLNGLNPDIAAKMSASGGKVPAAQLPTIPTAIQKAAPAAVPQIHQYYADALRNLDAVLAKKPDDVWALLYKWHLYAEDTGNLSEAMKQWKEAERRFPNNPGVQFFLGEGYLKEGNLKEAVMHASKAILLRGLGN